jgi:hypothetical protein
MQYYLHARSKRQRKAHSGEIVEEPPNSKKNVIPAKEPVGKGHFYFSSPPKSPRERGRFFLHYKQYI